MRSICVWCVRVRRRGSRARPPGRRSRGLGERPPRKCRPTTPAARGSSGAARYLAPYGALQPAGAPPAEPARALPRERRPTGRCGEAGRPEDRLDDPLVELIRVAVGRDVQAAAHPTPARTASLSRGRPGPAGGVEMHRDDDARAGDQVRHAADPAPSGWSGAELLHRAAHAPAGGLARTRRICRSDARSTTDTSGAWENADPRNASGPGRGGRDGRALTVHASAGQSLDMGPGGGRERYYRVRWLNDGSRPGSREFLR